MEEKFYSVSEIASLLDVSKETVRRAIRSGKLKATIKGRDFFVREWDLQTYTIVGESFGIEPSNLTTLSMGYEGAWPGAILFDNYFFSLEVQYQRIKDGEANVNAGLARQRQEMEQRLANSKPGAPPAYWSFSNKVMFLDIKLYFVVAECLRKSVEYTFKTVTSQEFKKIVKSHSQLFTNVKKLRGMLEHLPDNQVNNPKLGGDLGNISNGKFTFGNKEYELGIEEFRQLRDELSDFFIINNRS